MEMIRRFGAFGVVAITLASSLGLAAQSGDPAAIQQKLNATFTASKLTADRSDIVTTGSIVVLHKEGMMMYGFMSPLPPSNTYKNGKIVQGGSGFGRDLAISMMTPGGGTAASYPQRRFVADEKCFLTGIVVQKDGILVQLYSDPYDDIRYYGNLKIPYPNKKEVPPVDVAVQMVAEVLTVLASEDQASQDGRQAPVPAQAPVAAPAPPPMQAIAPPPPPADAPPPTINLGQTKEQVTAAFGQPTRMAKLGVKEIYYYKDMKVTFTNGKVTNVE
jgi:hypothetical protein